MPRQPRMDPDERLTQIVDTASELLSLKGYFGFSVGGVDWEAVEAGCAALNTRTAVAMLHALVEHNLTYKPQGPPTSPCGGWAPPPRHGSLGPC